MSQDIADMPGIDAAMERFDAMAGNDAGGANASTATAKTDNSIAARQSGSSALPDPDTRENGDRPAMRDGTPNKANAGPAANDEAQNSDTNPTSGFAKASPDGARAAADTAAGNDQRNRDAQVRFTANAKGSANGADSTASGESGQKGTSALPDNKSRYAKAQERLERTWESVNKRKGELDSQASALEQQRLTLERDKAQFEAIRRQADQPQATPEQALQAAQLRRRDADAMRMQARRAEDAGRSDEAQRLNKQAEKADGLADDLSEYAEQLRRNPPVTMQQRQQQFDQARKGWTLEACNAFPELGRHGSRLQQVVAQHLDGLAKQDPQLLAHPSLIYHVARLADSQIKGADSQAVAARVPVLEKEAESLRARIKELEAATTPENGNGVNRLGGEPKDDYASLRQSASEIGHGRW